MVASPNPEPQTAYVVMVGDIPMAVAMASLEAAQADAEDAEGRYADGGERRWDERRPGEWRLMCRGAGRRRFAWTTYSVVAVPAIESPAGGAA